VAQATVAPQIHEALHIELNLAAEVTLNLQALVDDGPDLPDIRLDMLSVRRAGSRPHSATIRAAVTRPMP